MIDRTKWRYNTYDEAKDSYVWAVKQRWYVLLPEGGRARYRDVSAHEDWVRETFPSRNDTTAVRPDECARTNGREVQYTDPILLQPQTGQWNHTAKYFGSERDQDKLTKYLLENGALPPTKKRSSREIDDCDDDNESEIVVRRRSTRSARKSKIKKTFCISSGPSSPSSSSYATLPSSSTPSSSTDSSSTFTASPLLNATLLRFLGNGKAKESPSNRQRRKRLRAIKGALEQATCGGIMIDCTEELGEIVSDILKDYGYAHFATFFRRLFISPFFDFFILFSFFFFFAFSRLWLRASPCFPYRSNLYQRKYCLMERTAPW